MYADVVAVIKDYVIQSRTEQMYALTFISPL